MEKQNYRSEDDQTKKYTDRFEHDHSSQKLPPRRRPSSNSASGTSEESESSRNQKKEKNLLPTFKALRERKTNFVFLFGRPGSGKTAIISSLCHYLSTNPSGALELRNSDNKEGMFFLKEIFRKGKAGHFLDRTARNKITEIDLMYTPRKPKKPMNLTFLEMSGEDLTKVELRKDDYSGATSGGILPDNIDVYLKCPKIKMIFLLVTEWKKAETDDILMFEFLDYVRKKQKAFRKPQVLLLVSKWDTYDGIHYNNIDAFVRENMKLTYNLLTQIEGSISYFTVGNVVEMENDDTREPLIADMDPTQSDVVKRWIYQSVTGKTIPRAGDNWINRFWNALNF